MKLNLFQLYLCLLLLLMVSCRKETAVSSFADVTESVSLKSLIGDEATISFTSTGSWTATTDVVWLNLSPLSGDAGKGLVKAVVTSENNSKEERKAKIELKSGTEVCEITVFQEAGDYVLPEHTEYVVGVEGGEVRIECVIRRAENLHLFRKWDLDGTKGVGSCGGKDGGVLACIP